MLRSPQDKTTRYSVLLGQNGLKLLNQVSTKIWLNRIILKHQENFGKKNSRNKFWNFFVPSPCLKMFLGATWSMSATRRTGFCSTARTASPTWTVLSSKERNRISTHQKSLIFIYLKLFDLQSAKTSKFLKQLPRLARGKVQFLTAERRCRRRRLCLPNTHCPARIPGKFSLKGTVLFANDEINNKSVNAAFAISGSRKVVFGQQFPGLDPGDERPQPTLPHRSRSSGED